MEVSKEMSRNAPVLTRESNKRYGGSRPTDGAQGVILS